MFCYIFEQIQKFSNAYNWMVFYHNALMEWLVDGDRYLNHMHQEETDKGKASPTRLAVTMPDGTTIVDETAASTFVKVIDKLGRRDVKNLNLKVNEKDFMTTSEDDQQRRKLGGYYINVGISTERKKRVLEDIRSRLDVKLEVKIIPK